MIKRQSKFMGVSPQKRGRALMAGTPPSLRLSPSGMDPSLGVRGDADATPGLWPPPEERPIGEPNGHAKAAPLARSVATPGAPAEGIFIHCRPVPSPSNPAPFPDDTPLKKDSNDSASPQSSPGPRYARLRLLGRPLLSFLRDVFPPHGEG